MVRGLREAGRPAAVAGWLVLGLVCQKCRMWKLVRKYWWLPTVGAIAYLIQWAFPQAALGVAIATTIMGVLFLIYLALSFVDSLKTSIDELKDRVDELLEEIREPDGGPHPPDTRPGPSTAKSEDQP